VSLESRPAVVSGGPSRGAAWRLSPCLALLAFALASAAARAWAAPGDAVTVKAACARAAEEGQRLRVRGKLRESLPPFTMCAAQRCPALIRTDCSGWRGEVEAALPTVVVRAVAADDPSRELYDVEVQVDGEIIARKLDGTALAVNPGEHTFGFRAGGGEPVTQRVVVRVGEKHRLIEVTLGAPASDGASASDPDPVAGAPTGLPPGPAPAAIVETPPAPRPPRMTTASWILLGVGGASLASAGYFGVTGYYDVKEIRDSQCAPSCAQGDVDAAKRRLLIADISLGAGLVALAGVGWLILSRPAPSGSAATVGVVPLRGGGALVGLRVGEVRPW
jgi:hypothetical protein